MSLEHRIVEECRSIVGACKLIGLEALADKMYWIERDVKKVLAEKEERIQALTKQLSEYAEQTGVGMEMGKESKPAELILSLDECRSLDSGIPKYLIQDNKDCIAVVNVLERFIRSQS